MEYQDYINELKEAAKPDIEELNEIDNNFKASFDNLAEREKWIFQKIRCLVLDPIRECFSVIQIESSHYGKLFAKENLEDLELDETDYFLSPEDIYVYLSVHPQGESIIKNLSFHNPFLSQLLQPLKEKNREEFVKKSSSLDLRELMKQCALWKHTLKIWSVAEAVDNVSDPELQESLDVLGKTTEFTELGLKATKNFYENPSAENMMDYYFVTFIEYLSMIQNLPYKEHKILDDLFLNDDPDCRFCRDTTVRYLHNKKMSTFMEQIKIKPSWWNSIEEISEADLEASVKNRKWGLSTDESTSIKSKEQEPISNKTGNGVWLGSCPNNIEQNDIEAFCKAFASHCTPNVPKMIRYFFWGKETNEVPSETNKIYWTSPKNLFVGYFKYAYKGQNLPRGTDKCLGKVFTYTNKKNEKAALLIGTASGVEEDVISNEIKVHK